MSSKTKCWLWMLLVILSETSATSTLKMFGSSEGSTRMLLLGLLIALYCTCYYSLSRAVKDIPVGLAYATWWNRYPGGLDAGNGILRPAPGYRRHHRHGGDRQRHRYHEPVLENGFRRERRARTRRASRLYG